MFGSSTASKLVIYRLRILLLTRLMHKYYRLSIAIAVLLGLTAYSAPTHQNRGSSVVTADFARKSNTLVIWKVGSFSTRDTPEAEIPSKIRRQAERLDYQVAVETFPAKGFTAKLRKAIAQNQEPDILTFDNFSTLEGTETNWEKSPGIYSIDGVQESLFFVNQTLSFLKDGRGFVTLLSTSPNHQIAKQLALPELECSNTAETQLIGDVDRNAIEKLVFNYSQDLAQANKAKIEQYKSRSAIIGKNDLSPMPIEELKICSIVANQNLAAVSTVIAHDGRAIGHLDLLMVLRRENDSWRLLTQQMDIVNQDARPYINKLADAIANSDVEEASPLPATNLAPQNVRPRATKGKRFGDFTWQPSQSDSVVAEVIEFSHGVDAKLFVKFKDDDAKVKDSISAGELYHTDKDTWRWRVWSIAADGSVAFSETQSFQDN